jgi:cytochrome c
MRNRKMACAALGAVLLAGPAGAADAGHGKILFTACLACHTEQADAQGPSLKGVFGRKAASLEDYRYSPAMKRANIVWDNANLSDYLRDPQAKVKGNHMPFSGFVNAREADDVVAYLQTYK